MFGISGEEFIVILVIVLLFLGPKELPRLLRTIGNIMYEIRKTADEVRLAIESQDDELQKAKDIYAELEEEGKLEDKVVELETIDKKDEREVK